MVTFFSVSIIAVWIFVVFRLFSLYKEFITITPGEYILVCDGDDEIPMKVVYFNTDMNEIRTEGGHVFHFIDYFNRKFVKTVDFE